MKKVIKNINTEIPEKKHTPNIINKVGEFFILLSVASLLIFYLFKNIFGTPLDIKNNSLYTKESSLNIDTIKGMQQFTMENIYSINQKNDDIITLLKEQNELIKVGNQNISKDIDNLKKAVYTKIPKPADTSKKEYENKPVSFDKSKLDSFFKSRRSTTNK